MTGGVIETEPPPDGNTTGTEKCKIKFNLKKLRLSLKYRPKLLHLILNLRRKIQKKNKLLSYFRHQLKLLQTKAPTNNTSSQTDNTEIFPQQSKELPKNDSTETSNVDIREPSENTLDWNIDKKNGENEKSIAEQVKEAAQSALDQNGMVFVESAGMYYDYKTGYYYNSELGLYYHTDTNCYYFYSDEKQTFVFHSYPATSKVSAASEALKRHEKKKAKKHKQDKEDVATIANKKKKNKEGKIRTETKDENKAEKKKSKSKKSVAKESEVISKDEKEIKDEITIDVVEKDVNEKSKEDKNKVLEDGECSDSADDAGDEDKGSESPDEDCASSSTASEDDDDSVARHHPPCMRVIVKATELSLKVGSLFVVTKDGGTIGREGEHHTILLEDERVSRNHLDIKYDMSRRMYTAMDLGSTNGTVLNGQRMSESQVPSPAMEIKHGSMLQLGATKLLCHIHQGNDTCGHCEPGLVMAADEKDKKVAYTRVCSVQKQHSMELARLKNKYAPEPLAIEDGSYNDRAKARRETVGSSHGSEKTQQSDLDTSIAPDNKGFQLLSKMGWAKGEGLGKDSQGHTEPIPLVSNDSKAGLGAHGSAAPVTVGSVGSVPMRMRRNKSLRPPAKLFRDPLEEDDD